MVCSEKSIRTLVTDRRETQELKKGSPRRKKHFEPEGVRIAEILDHTLPAAKIPVDGAARSAAEGQRDPQKRDARIQCVSFLRDHAVLP
jgi:hypothetical protein